MFFEFAKDAGEALRNTFSNLAEGITDRIQGNKSDVKDLEVEENDGTVVIKGKAANRGELEKAVIAAGNTPGVSRVETQVEIEEDGPQAIFYTVKSGDTLSKIAQEHYGDPMKYPAIFGANTPMLSDPDKIYPGQTLRIPHLD